jgi:hypothetical protein
MPDNHHHFIHLAKTATVTDPGPSGTWIRFSVEAQFADPQRVLIPKGGFSREESAVEVPVSRFLADMPGFGMMRVGDFVQTALHQILVEFPKCM